MDAVIYMRWSSTEQTRGSSLSRQRQLCQDHCAAKGWRIADEIRDEGVSAWTGKNAVEGNLARFIDQVEAGAYREGVVLVVEQLDRLSRRPVIDMFDWLRSTAALGVRISTVVGDGFYQHGSFDLTAIIRVAVEADLAHRQSQDKSTKLAASWRHKREKQAAGTLAVLTKRAPAWLEVVGSPPRFAIIEGRATIVRRIFEETAAGFGKHHIARNLNRDGVATFGRASGWHASYIQKILNSAAVLGEFQPGRKPRGEKRTTEGDPIQGYYPAIVDADLHARARTSMGSRSRMTAGRGRRLANIFSGIAICGECGSKMTFRSKGRKVRASGKIVHEDYLICDSYQRGRGCANATHFNYAGWEMAVLNGILQKALGDEHFASPGQIRSLEITLAETVRRRDAENARKEKALDLFLETDRPEAKERFITASAAADKLNEEVVRLRKDLIGARGAVSPAEHQRRIHQLVDKMEADDEDERFEARSRVMTAVHELTSEMRMNAEGPAVDLLRRDGLSVRIEWDEGPGSDADFTYRFDAGFFD